MTSPLFSNGAKAATVTATQPAAAPDFLNESVVPDAQALVPTSTASPTTAVSVVKPLELDAYISDLGSTSAGKIAKSSSVVLAHAKSSELDQFGMGLTDLIVKTKNLRPDTLSSGLIGKVKNFFGNAQERFLAEFNSVEKQLDRMVAEISTHKVQQQKSVQVLEQLYRENQADHDALEKEIASAQALYDRELAKLDQVDTSTLDIMDQQVVSDNRNRLERLRRRISELKGSLIVAEQTAPEIRQMQTNANMIVDKFDAIQVVAIPIWKKQFSLAIINSRAARSIEVINMATDATNEIMTRNAAALKQNSIAITSATAEAMIKAETVEQVNASFIEMLTETDQILKDSKAKNEETERRMLASNASLLEAMKKHNRGFNA